jgi:hypothetical protein
VLFINARLLCDSAPAPGATRAKSRTKNPIRCAENSAILLMATLTKTIVLFLLHLRAPLYGIR